MIWESSHNGVGGGPRPKTQLGPSGLEIWPVVLAFILFLEN